MIDELEQAKEILNQILLATQQDVKGYIEQIVTNLVSHVFGDEYVFMLEMGIEREKPALTPIIEKQSIQVSPRDEMGGGLLDMISLGLRMALWSFNQDRFRPTLIMDEPGKFLDLKRVPLFGEALQQLSKQLGLQIIMVTHLDDLKGLADRSYRVWQQNGVSLIEEEGKLYERSETGESDGIGEERREMGIGKVGRRATAGQSVGDLPSNPKRKSRSTKL